MKHLNYGVTFTHSIGSGARNAGKWVLLRVKYRLNPGSVSLRGRNPGSRTVVRPRGCDAKTGGKIDGQAFLNT